MGITGKAKQARAKLAAMYYGKPAKDMKLIAVTGKGSTVVAQYLKEILRAMDPRIEVVRAGKSALGVQKQLSRVWKEGANYVVLDVSAAGLGGALTGLPMYMVVVCDGADRDAAELFQPAPEFAVLNMDGVGFADLAGLGAKNVLTYGRSREAMMWIGHSKLYKKGAEATLTSGGSSFDVATYAADEAAAEWMAAAAAAGLVMGVEVDAVVDGIAEVEL